MKGILADYNMTGHLDRLVRTFFESDEWMPFWSALGLVVETFTTLNLPRTTPDDEIWRLCQEHELVLITMNRNDDGPTSLEAILR